MALKEIHRSLKKGENPCGHSMTREGDIATAKTVISFPGLHLGAIDLRRRTQKKKIEHLKEKAISQKNQTAWVAFIDRGISLRLLTRTARYHSQQFECRE